MFDAQLTRALASSDRNKNIVGLMIIDLDGFKPVNDTLGHDAGDLVLRTIAARLRALLRKEAAQWLPDLFCGNGSGPCLRLVVTTCLWLC